jgi:hypothetical protein
MINRVDNLRAVPPPGDSGKVRLIATEFEKELTEYVAVFLNLKIHNLEAQLGNMAHRTVALNQKAQEAQIYVK